MQAKEIGAFEAKTHLSSLLEKVQRGQSFYITKRGKRVALLKNCELEVSQKIDPSSLLQQFRTLRQKSRPGRESLKELIEKGRRL